jgi:hypothetical protein
MRSPLPLRRRAICNPFAAGRSINIVRSGTRSPGSHSNNADIGDWFKSRSFTYSAGPTVQWNILNYGQITNKVRVEDALTPLVAGRYERSPMVDLPADSPVRGTDFPIPFSPEPGPVDMAAASAFDGIAHGASP